WRCCLPCSSMRDALSGFGIVLATAHAPQVREQIGNVVVAQVRVRRHVAVAEGAGVFDVDADLRLGAVLDRALRNVQIGPDAPTLAVDRVAADALASKERETPHRRSVIAVGY